MIPNLFKNDIFWEGTVKLVEWENFFQKKITLLLNVGGDCIIDQITEIHENAFHYLIEQQINILDAAIKEIYKNYPLWQDEYNYNEDEKEFLMPNLSCIEDLKKLVNPKKIYIMDVETDNMAYFGIEFQCRWDEEHGVGLMFHKNRVVKIGGADTAFMTWIAEEDKER